MNVITDGTVEYSNCGGGCGMSSAEGDTANSKMIEIAKKDAVVPPIVVAPVVEPKKDINFLHIGMALLAGGLIGWAVVKK